MNNAFSSGNFLLTIVIILIIFFSGNVCIEIFLLCCFEITQLSHRHLNYSKLQPFLFNVDLKKHFLKDFSLKKCFTCLLLGDVLFRCFNLHSGSLLHFTIASLPVETMQTTKKGVQAEIQKDKEVRITLRGKWLSNMDLNKKSKKAVLTTCQSRRQKYIDDQLVRIQA